MYVRPSRILPGDRIVTDSPADARVISWRRNDDDDTFTARLHVGGNLDGCGLRIAAAPVTKHCCGQTFGPGTVVHDDGGCHGNRVAAGAGIGGHPLTDSMDLPVYVRRRPLVLPPLTWLGEHAATYDPERGGSGRLYRCVRCNTRDGWSLSCAWGLTVHLPAQPAPPWTVDDLAAAAEYWLGRGYAVKPAPQAVHPTYRVCAGCSTQDLLYRQIDLPHVPHTLEPE
jgi:hypothetical protein